MAQKHWFRVWMCRVVDVEDGQELHNPPGHCGWLVRTETAQAAKDYVRRCAHPDNGPEGEFSNYPDFEAIHVPQSADGMFHLDGG